MPPKPDPERKLNEDQQAFSEKIHGMFDVAALRALWKEAQPLDMMSELAWRAVEVENLADRADRRESSADEGIETVTPEVLVDEPATD